MTLCLREVPLKMVVRIVSYTMYLPRCEKHSSTGDLNGFVIHSLLTCYFVNLPRILYDRPTPLLFCRKPVFSKQITPLYTEHIVL